MKWLDKPAEHDYLAAWDYLTLILHPDRAGDVVERLQAAGVRFHRANDVLRASGYRLLPKSDPSVAKDVKRIADGRELSPVLLVRMNGRVEIADGFHRICACIHHDPDTEVPAALVTL